LIKEQSGISFEVRKIAPSGCTVFPHPLQHRWDVLLFHWSRVFAAFRWWNLLRFVTLSLGFL